MKKKQLPADKFILAIIFLSFLILGGGIFWAGKLGQSPKIATSSEAKIETSETTYSWGEIPLEGGKVRKVFTLKNKGGGVLKLFNIKTSCMCTTAYLIIGKQKSPPFGMHSRSPWVGEVLPGEEAKLEVIFDPGYHGAAGLGVVRRQVVLSTNDSKTPQVTFTLTAKVVK